MPDQEHGGFYGQITAEDKVAAQAPKGAVLNARILWTFSTAYRHQSRPEHLALATRAFEYLEQHFLDREYGGLFWSVDYLGQPLDTKKQIYALAFAIYGLAEYYAVSGQERVLTHAQALFQAIETHSFDAEKGGYLEALSREWRAADDLRLSDKDANEKKTMNTHLHILEAYTNLYRVWPDARLHQQIRHLLAVFAEHIIDPRTQHLLLFFDENWVSKAATVSFGHDIEAAWLLLEAAEVLEDEALIGQFKQVAVHMARAAAEGLDADGGMSYELESAHQHWNREKHWWVQAESMVGFLTAYQLSGEEHFRDKFLAVWNFTHEHLIDHENGEWFWGIQPDYSLMPGEDKAGFWKCPYHNSRALLEVLRRTKQLDYK